MSNIRKSICSAIACAIVTLGLTPLFCVLAWNTFAWEFNLPTFTYWHWMVVILAIRGTLGKTDLKFDWGK